MDINSIRSEIDSLDCQLVQILNKRLKLAAEIGHLKRSQGSAIYVPEREEQVFAKVSEQNSGPIPQPALRAIYREIMSAAIALEKPLTIAFLGPEATFTHQAAVKKFGASVCYRAFSTNSDIFQAVEKGDVDYGVVPIENSTDGTVRDSLDLFAESDLKIIAQIYLEISQSLISNEPLERITKVYSKDIALAQCRQWLRRNLPNAQYIETASTSAAVQMAKTTEGIAAIASRMAAEHYAVPVQADSIQDKNDNTTRFFVISRQPSGPVGNGKDISSFLVSLGDDAAAQPGALLKMLLPMSERGINLTKVESRPNKRRPWSYFFYLDVTGHYNDPKMQEALTVLHSFCPMVKWLGSYPAASL